MLQVEWQYEVNSKYKSYAPRINHIIEKAHANQQKYAEWTENEHVHDKKSIKKRVYFDKLIETVAHSRASCINVNRKLLGGELKLL